VIPGRPPAGRLLPVLLLTAWLIPSGPAAAVGQRPAPKLRTLVHDQPALDRLMGKHLLSLQWISWRRFGTVEITDDRGLLVIKGEQRARRGDDYLKIDGIILEVGKRFFRFEGTIVTRVSYINEGKPCRRRGRFVFRITGKRKYWRLKQRDNPCDVAADYVDIYFARPR